MAAPSPCHFFEGHAPIIQSNYFDLGMLMDYWGERRLNHHTEATSMFYAAREAVRLVLALGTGSQAKRSRPACRPWT